MSRTSNLQFAMIAALVALAACSDSDVAPPIDAGSPTPDMTDDLTDTQTDFSELANAWCAKQQSCNRWNFQLEFSDMENCTNRAEPILAASLGDSNWSQSEWTACIEALNGECTARFWLPEACHFETAGSGDDTCQSGFDCPESFWCELRGAGCGECIDLSPPLNRCDWDENLDCEPGSFCVSGTCLPEMPEGSPCGRSAWCDAESSCVFGECVPLATEGEECVVWPESNGTSASPICEGNAGLRCVNGTCRASVVTTAGTDLQCASPIVQCDASSVCSNRTGLCDQKVATGEPCVGRAECGILEFCMDGVCIPAEQTACGER